MYYFPHSFSVWRVTHEQGFSRIFTRVNHGINVSVAMILFQLLEQEHFQSIHYTFLPLYFAKLVLIGAELIEKINIQSMAFLTITACFVRS
jgi:hypothetical protein